MYLDGSCADVDGKNLHRKIYPYSSFKLTVRFPAHSPQPPPSHTRQKNCRALGGDTHSLLPSSLGLALAEQFDGFDHRDPLQNISQNQCNILRTLAKAPPSELDELLISWNSFYRIHRYPVSVRVPDTRGRISW